METPVLTLGEEEAKTHYDEYAEQIKKRGEKAEQYLKDLKSTYYHLSQGRKVLDIFQVFKSSGVNENGEPKLAIAPASSSEITFVKYASGSGSFLPEGRWSRKDSTKVELPSDTFPAWKRGMVKNSWNDKEQEGTLRETINTDVPLIPAHILPDGALDKYYILFEVTDWREPKVTRAAQKGDPYLLKRINMNTFAVLAEWDVTDIELAVLRGKS